MMRREKVVWFFVTLAIDIAGWALAALGGICVARALQIQLAPHAFWLLWSAAVCFAIAFRIPRWNWNGNYEDN